MVALVIVSTFIVLMLGILVAGLLRSHADILRALHDLGAGVGDPSTAPATTTTAAPVTFTPPASGLGLGLDPSSELGAAPAIAGVTPTGDARAVAVDNSDDFTLLGFLSSGCTGCAAFWDALQEPGRLQLPDRTRVVIVTKGPDREIPAEVLAKATGRVPVVMSTDAWLDYQVPGSPFFVLVDGATGRKVGQGVASQVGQLAELVRRAEHDRGHSGGTRGRSEPSLAGPAREAAADEVLAAAGILPGDPSLYPRTLADVFPHGNPVPAE
jgi:hypothetical protein